MALRSIRKVFTFRTKTDLSSSDVSSAIESPPTPITVPISPPQQDAAVTANNPEDTIATTRNHNCNHHHCNHHHRDARDEEMQVLRDMNVALKVQLTEALQRIDELQLESVSSESLPLTIPAIPEPEPVPRCCIDLEPFKAGDMVMRLPCFHVHHSECLLPYLKNQEEPECPECRTKIPKDHLDNLPIWQWEPPNNSGAAASSS